MKLNIRFWKYQVIERIKKIKNNRLILGFLVVILLLVVLIPLFFILFNTGANKYQGVTNHSLQERFQADTITCTENIKEKDTITCRRGPVVIAATDKIVRKLLNYRGASGLTEQKITFSEFTSINNKAKLYRYHWGLLPDLVNWFYNNVPWGIEILTFDNIILTGANAPDWLPNYKLKGAAYGKHWGKKNSGVRIFLKTLLSGLEADFNNEKLVEKKLNNLKYYLFNTYVNFKMGWYVNDESTTYYYGGGVEAKNYREKINKKVISDYLTRRFNVSNDNPISMSESKILVYNKLKAYEYLQQQLPNLELVNINDKSTLSYRDLFVLANDVNKLTTTSSFGINDTKHHWIFDGIDKFGSVGNEVTWFQLNSNELLQQFKQVEIKIKSQQKRVKIEELKKEELATVLQNNKITPIIDFEVDFNGYSASWIQQYLWSLVVPILWTQKIDTIKNFELKNNYQDIINQYEQLSTKPEGVPLLIKPNRFPVEKFETDEQLKIGLLNHNSQLDYVNKMRSFIARDWEILNFNKSFIENSNGTSLMLKDQALLNHFNANPYQTTAANKISPQIAVDTGTVSSLQKLLRMDEDVAMGHLSVYSELSFIWGYMNEDDNYDYLKLTDRVGQNRFIKITTQNDLDKNYNCHHDVSCNFEDQHSLISNEFINNEEFKFETAKFKDSPKTLLSKIVNPQAGLKTARKLWVTDYSLLADYTNAVAPAGEYKISFFNSKSKNERALSVSPERKKYGEIKNDTRHILNSNGNITPFAGWWFYTRYAKDNELFFKIAEQSWINK